MIKNISQKGENKTGWYEFDSVAKVHTTNELHRLMNKQISTVTVIGHDGNTSTPKYKGDIYLPHNGNTVCLRNVLYHRTYSNLISGLKVLKVSTIEFGEMVILKHGPDVVYDMERTPERWWVKLDNLGPGGKKVLIREVATDIQK